MITLNKKKHIYSDEKGTKYHSVTEFIKTFFSPFDEKEIARKLASFPANKKQKHGVRYFLKQWKEDRERGTRVHEEIEKLLLQGNKDRNIKLSQSKDLKTTQAMFAFKKIVDCMDTFVVSPEYIISNVDLKLAGTIDCVITAPSGTILLDWKTNKKMDKKGYKGRKAQEPLSFMDDTSFSKYILQLSMYAYMMELDNPKLLLVHLKDDGYDIIDIPYMKDTVKELLKIRAFQVTQLE